MMRIFILFLALCVISQLKTSQGKTKVVKKSETNIEVFCQGNKIPTIDANKKYPVKKIYWEDIADIEFIPLETNRDILIDKSSSVSHVSDNCIIVVNHAMGDIFIFNRNGNIRNHFNHKGKSGMEYSHITGVAYDEKSKEIFVNSFNRMLVYSEDGKYHRTLPISQKDQYYEFFNYNDQSLLVFNKSVEDKYPYKFFSKKDGSIVPFMGLSFKNRISNTNLKQLSASESISKSISYQYLHKNGSEILISDISSDTIYQLSSNNQIIPIMTKTPSVQNFEPNQYKVISLVKKTDKLMLFFKYVIDLNLENRTTPSVSMLLYDLEKKQIYEPDFDSKLMKGGGNITFAKTDLSKNVFVVKYSADWFVEKLLKGELNDQAKEVATTLDEEDNPVLEIITFK